MAEVIRYKEESKGKEAEGFWKTLLDVDVDRLTTTRDIQNLINLMIDEGWITGQKIEVTGKLDDKTIGMIKRVQMFLIENGYRVIADGDFGRYTRVALKRFIQSLREHKILSKGIPKRTDKTKKKETTLHGKMEGLEVIDIESEVVDLSEKEINRLKKKYTDFISLAVGILRDETKNGGFGWLDKPKTMEELMEFLLDIDSIVWEYFQVENIHFLIDGLDIRVLDCDLSAVVVSDILSEFGMKTQFETIPLHVLLKVDMKGKYLYFESRPPSHQENPRFFTDADIDLGYPLRYGTTESFKPIVYKTRGVNRFYNGDILGAVNDFTKVIELAPNNPMGYLDRGNVLIRLGKVSAAKKDFAAAMDIYNRLISAQPDNYLHYLRRAFTKEEMGNNEGAIKDYKNATQLLRSSDLPRSYTDILISKVNERIARLSMKMR